ncbi:type VII secretion-associated protein [Nocardia callitridis]|uniref:Type VII secretion-associated protein n=1 Tax=Nocardia callitridis TaxID=648753 RepID=A0ABP9L0E8_9NOCA
MSTVELVVTDTRIWARGATTHWDVPPSVVLASNGVDLVVGEPVTPPTQVSSAVQFVPGDGLALLPRVPSVLDALSAVFATVLHNLGVQPPCERILLVCSTEWGATRRGLLERAARQFAQRVDFEDMAVRAVAADHGTSHSRRTLVLEFATLTTTVTAVIRGHEGVHIESCEHEPTLALPEIIGPESPGLGKLHGLLGRMVDGQSTDLVQAVGLGDPSSVEVVRSAVEQICGPGVELRPVTGPDLVRGRRPEPHEQPQPTMAMPRATEWMQPLRERAAAQQPERKPLGFVLAGVGVLVLVVAVVLGVVLVGGSDKPATTATAAEATTHPSSVAPTTPDSGTSETFGRLRFQVPEGWQVAAPSDQQQTSHVVLTPTDGTRQRITVTQTPLDPDFGYDQVAAQLETQMAQRPRGVLGELRRDVVFGGRSGLAYTERPGDGSTVRWHVLLEYGVQASVGCQYVGDGWPQLETSCEEFGNSVHVTE